MTEQSQKIIYASLALVITNGMFFAATQDTLLVVNTIYVAFLILLGAYATLFYYVPMHKVNEEAVFTTVIFGLCLFLVPPAGIEGFSGISYTQHFLDNMIK